MGADVEGLAVVLRCVVSFVVAAVAVFAGMTKQNETECSGSSYAQQKLCKYETQLGKTSKRGMEFALPLLQFQTNLKH